MQRKGGAPHRGRRRGRKEGWFMQSRVQRRNNESVNEDGWLNGREELCEWEWRLE